MMSLIKTKLYLITDRKVLSPPHLKNLTSEQNLDELLSFCVKASESGIDLLQIREKDLSAKDLSNFVSQLTKEVKHTSILVNDRLDIALSCGANGVHLPSNSFPVKDVRKLVGNDFIISVSTHNIEEAKLASDQGADFILFSPIFDTPSKRIYGKPLGLELLRQATKTISCPIIALGGITRENACLVLESKVAGLAAIRLFAETPNLSELVNELKEL
ncbi:MAG: thiamine phosphate synthase [Acidobacteria bacterium]|nr:thiamine phosphate synthase [Acidobacteriota bacterium]